MLQTFVAVSLMQPVVWHMKKVEVADENTDGKGYPLMESLFQTILLLDLFYNKVNSSVMLGHY